MKNLHLLFLIFALGSAFADPSPPANRDPQWLTESRVSIKSGKYEQAIQILGGANQANSAEWNNLMGYSLRQKQPPDLIGAQKYYETALSIDPNHKGTLEYYGMLKLINGDLPGAELLLARLNKACFFWCEEYTDLKEAIRKYKLAR
jgi:Flp pilus assembly protein TadD